MVPKICSIPECTKALKARGLCDMHYQRNRLNGSPLISKRPGLGLSMHERMDLYTDKSGDCWIWTGGGTRYGKTSLNSQAVAAHVASYERWNGTIPHGAVVRHKCDIPKCIRPDHLELGSNADNSQDMTDRDRQAKGTQQWCAKMTDTSVAELRETYASGHMGMVLLARRYGLSTSTVAKIIHRVTWKHVPERKAA